MNKAKNLFLTTLFFFSTFGNISAEKVQNTFSSQNTSTPNIENLKQTEQTIVSSVLSLNPVDSMDTYLTELLQQKNFLRFCEVVFEPTSEYGNGEVAQTWIQQFKELTSTYSNSEVAEFKLDLRKSIKSAKFMHKSTQDVITYVKNGGEYNGDREAEGVEGAATALYAECGNKNINEFMLFLNYRALQYQFIEKNLTVMLAALLE